MPTNRLTIKEAIEISGNLIRFRDAQSTSRQTCSHPESSIIRARQRAEDLKPVILRQIADAGGLNNVDTILALIGRCNIASSRIQGLDLLDLLK